MMCFFIGLRRIICLRAKVRNLVFINCFTLLLVGIDCVTDTLKATFS